MSTLAITRTIFTVSDYVTNLLVVAGGPSAALVLALGGLLVKVRQLVVRA